MMGKLAVAVIIMVGLVAAGALYVNGFFAGVGKALFAFGTDTTAETGKILIIEREGPTRQPLESGSTYELENQAPAGARFVILDGEPFVLAANSKKTLEFTINGPVYPLKVAGDMKVSGSNSITHMRLTEKENPANFLTSMTAGYSLLGGSKVTLDDYIKESRLKSQPGVVVYSSDIKAGVRENPTFIATFENAGNSAQTVTANLAISWG